MSERTPVYITNLQLSDLLLAFQLKQLAGFEPEDQPSVEEVHAALLHVRDLNSAIDHIISLGWACKAIRNQALRDQFVARTPQFDVG